MITKEIDLPQPEVGFGPQAKPSPEAGPVPQVRPSHHQLEPLQPQHVQQLTPQSSDGNLQLAIKYLAAATAQNFITKNNSCSSLSSTSGSASASGSDVNMPVTCMKYVKHVMFGMAMNGLLLVIIPKDCLPQQKIWSYRIRTYRIASKYTWIYAFTS